MTRLCQVRDSIADELQNLQDKHFEANQQTVMIEMGYVQLLALANQLILGGEVESAHALEDPKHDMKLTTQVYVQLKFLMKKQAQAD